MVNFGVNLLEHIFVIENYASENTRVLLNFDKMDFSNRAPSNLTLPRFHLILCTFTFNRMTAISVYIHEIIYPLICTLSLLTNSLLVKFTQLCPRGLARQFYKTTNSVSF